jgi:hypothetical protein
MEPLARRPRVFSGRHRRHGALDLEDRRNRDSRVVAAAIGPVVRLADHSHVSDGRVRARFACGVLSQDVEMPQSPASTEWSRRRQPVARPLLARERPSL